MKTNIHFWSYLRVEQLGPVWTDFRENFYFSVYFGKHVEKSQFSLKSDKNIGHFTWTPIYISDHISLSSSYNNKCFRK